MTVTFMRQDSRQAYHMIILYRQQPPAISVSSARLTFTIEVITMEKKKCWVEQPNNQDFYVSTWRMSAPVCKQSFTPRNLNFKCDNITRDVYEPQPGSVVKYTCTANGTG